MKAKDLVNATEYLQCPGQDWLTNTYTGTGHGATKRVRMMDAQPGIWMKDPYGSFVRVSDGPSWKTFSGVRVMILDRETGADVVESIVSLASIRGAWTPTWEKVQYNVQQRELMRQAQAATRAKRNDIVGTALAIMEKLGITKHKASNYNGSNGQVLIDGEIFLAMVTELEKQGWVYSPKQ